MRRLLPALRRLPNVQDPAARTLDRRLAAEAAVVAAMLTIFAIVTLPALRQDGTFYGQVLSHWFGPEKHGVASRLADFDVPLWSRSAFAGEPLVANMQHGVFYPLNLPFWVMRTSSAFDVVVALHLVLGGLGTWALCRLTLRCGSLGATLAGLAFGFGGYSLAHIVLINQLQVIAWVPWVLFAVQRCLDRPGLRPPVLLAAFIGLQFLAGHPEEWVYTFVLIGAWCGAWWLSRPGDERWEALRRGSFRILLALGLFGLLFAWQLGPTLRLQSLGYRSDLGSSRDFPLPKESAINALLPDYGSLLIGENAAYVGVVVLVLAALGVTRPDTDWWWVRAWCVAISAFGFVMALGAESAVFRVVVDVVPVLDDFRVPARWLLLPYVAMCVLGAFGMDALLAAPSMTWRRHIRHAATGAAALLVGLVGALLVADVTRTASLGWWTLAAVFTFGGFLLAHRPQVAPATVGAVLLVVSARELEDARPLGEWRQVVPGEVYDDAGPVLDLIAAEGGRLVSGPDLPIPEGAPPIPVPEGITGIDGAYYRAGFESRILAQPMTQIAVGAESVLGRDGGLYPTGRWVEWFRAAVVDAPSITGGGFALPPSAFDFDGLDQTAVRWWVSPTLPSSEQAVLRSHGFRPVLSYAYAEVWERDPPPLARVVHDVTVISDANERLDLIGSPSHDPTETAVIEGPLDEGLGDRSAGDSVEVREVADERVVIDATVAETGLLVLADPWYPGWRVTVDGEEADLVRVDHTFRGVVLEPGEHVVEFTYHDRLFTGGIVLAVLTAVGLAGVAGWRRRGRTREAGRP